MRHVLIALLAMFVLSKPFRCVGRPPIITWYPDIASGRARAEAQDRPALIFLEASWDSTSAAMKRQTLGDPEIRRLLHSGYVAVDVDGADD